MAARVIVGLLDFGLHDRVALVFGAAHGMGRASALALSEGGARVACFDVAGDGTSGLVQTIRESKHGAIAITGDVRSRHDVERAVGAAIDEWGRLDVAVDVVGLAHWGPLVDDTDEDWRSSYEWCLHHVFVTAQVCCRQMIAQGGGGSFVSITSIDGFHSALRHSSYGAFKAGIVSLTKSLACEVAGNGIRVNAIAPGAIETSLRPDDAGLQAHAIPLGRRGRPEEIGTVVVFLASNLATYVTGQTIVVDGGVSVVSALPAVRREQ